MPSKKIILMVSIGALLMGCMSACVEEKSTQDPTGSISAAVTRNGLPNDKDSCPDHDSPPNFDLGMSCSSVSDCTNVPVACVDPLNPSEATCEPVWVGCKSNRCVTQPNNDWDAFGDICDPDDDQDGWCDEGVIEPLRNGLVIPVECEGSDNCHWIWNEDQLNTDWLLSQEDNSTVVGDMLGDACDDDDDNDGDADDNDTCPTVPNADQSDMDNDGDGDACDDDDDNDGDADDNDTCPTEWNPWQEDNDHDAIPGVGGGDACDDDDDDDNVTDDDDNCPTVPNTDQADFDGDGVPGGTDDPRKGGDACDRDCTGDGVEEMEDDEEFPNWGCQGDSKTSCASDTEEEDCDDENQCTDDWCDDGVCRHTNTTDSCDDGLYCNGTDTCAGGQCVHASAPCALNTTDSNCSTSCNEGTDTCTAPDPNGTSCDDGLYCNGTDTCNAGVCTVHASAPCALNTTDSNCSTSCNEGTDTCTAPDPNGTSCNDGNSCTASDMCTGGTCGGTADPQCGACGGITCDQGDSCQGNRCVASNEELWCWDSGSPASCKTHSGYDSPVIWEYDMSPSAPPKCTGPDQQWSPNPLCCVAVDPLPQGNIPCTTQPANPYLQ